MNIKHLLNGVAIVAALAIAGPVWAQNAPPAPPPGPEPAPAANSAMPPVHHHHAVRHAHAMHAHHRQMAHRAALTGDTTAQLNREELARIQSGGPPPPPLGQAPPSRRQVARCRLRAQRVAETAWDCPARTLAVQA